MCNQQAATCLLFIIRAAGTYREAVSARELHVGRIELSVYSSEVFSQQPVVYQLSSSGQER